MDTDKINIVIRTLGKVFDDAVVAGAPCADLRAAYLAAIDIKAEILTSKNI